MNGALAQLVPDRMPAAGDGGATLAFFTGRVAGEPFVYNELVVGTWGGRPVRDGNDGLANPCASIANIPVEVAETEWPIVVERYGLVPDSGGAGRFRGGLAIERVWRASPRTPSSTCAPTGRCTGRTASPAAAPGAPSSNADLSGRAASSSRCRRCSSPTFQPGDVFHHRMAGGGGWGNPLERDGDAHARDLRDGKVTA